MQKLGDLTGKWKTRNNSFAIVSGTYNGKYMGNIEGVIHFWDENANCEYDHGYDLMEKLPEGNYPPIRSGHST